MKKIITILILISLFACNADKATEFYEKAFELEEQEKYEEAIAYLDKAIQLNPLFEQAYLDRAIDKSILENYEGAIQDLNKLILIRPDAIEPYVSRAEFKRMVGQNKSSIYDIEVALNLKGVTYKDGKMHCPPELDYSNPDVKNKNMDVRLEYLLFERGAANYHLGNLKLALKDLDFCANNNLNSGLTKYYRGITLVALGDKKNGCIELNDSYSLGFEVAKEAIEKDCIN